MLGLVTIFIQMYLVGMYGLEIHWVLGLSAIFCLIGMIKLFATKKWLNAIFSVSMLIVLLVVPAAWSFWTVSPVNPNVNLPSAYEGIYERGNQNANEKAESMQSDLFSFLQANQGEAEYLLAVPNAFSGASIVIETGEPVLYMGGFSGSDPVVDVDDIIDLVESGDLKFIMSSGNSKGTVQQVYRWVEQNCSVVDEISIRNSSGKQNAPGQNQGTQIYQCAE